MSNVEHLEIPNGKIKKKIGTFLLYSFPFSIIWNLTGKSIPGLSAAQQYPVERSQVAGITLPQPTIKKNIS